MKSADLYCRTEIHDKEYHIWIRTAGKLFSVDFSYGRIGSTLQEGTKTPEPVSLKEAEKVLIHFVREKVAKGYVPENDGQEWLKRFCLVAEV